MLRLEPPDLDAVIVYREVAEGQQEPTRTLLLDSVGPVSAAYEAFAHAVARDATDLTPAGIGPAERDMLQRNYERLSDSHRFALFETSPDRLCPYCGCGGAATLDHYLPKNIFPEFAVLPINLVPSCGVCNNYKGDLWRSGDDSATFLHAYFDHAVLAGHQFLCCEIRVVERTVLPLFTVEPAPGIPGLLRDRIVHHFEVLHLEDELFYVARDTIASRSASSRAMCDIDPSQLRNALLFDAWSAEQHLGANHWRTCLLDALAASAPYCEGEWD